MKNEEVIAKAQAQWKKQNHQKALELFQSCLQSRTEQLTLQDSSNHSVTVTFNSKNETVLRLMIDLLIEMIEEETPLNYAAQHLEQVVHSRPDVEKHRVLLTNCILEYGWIQCHKHNYDVLSELLRSDKIFHFISEHRMEHGNEMKLLDSYLHKHWKRTKHAPQEVEEVKHHHHMKPNKLLKRKSPARVSDSAIEDHILAEILASEPKSKKARVEAHHHPNPKHHNEHHDELHRLKAIHAKELEALAHTIEKLKSEKRALFNELQMRTTSCKSTHEWNIKTTSDLATCTFQMFGHTFHCEFYVTGVETITEEKASTHVSILLYCTDATVDKPCHVRFRFELLDTKSSMIKSQHYQQRYTHKKQCSGPERFCPSSHLHKRDYSHLIHGEIYWKLVIRLTSLLD